MVQLVQTTDDNVMRLMRVACWIPKATDTHSEFVIRFAFPRRQWLSERASMSRHTCVFNFTMMSVLTETRRAISASS